MAKSPPAGGHSSQHAWLRRLCILSLLHQRDWSLSQLASQLEHLLGEDEAFASRDAAIYALRRDIKLLNQLPGCRIQWQRRERVYRLESSPITFGLSQSDLQAVRLLKRLFQENLPHRQEVSDFLERVSGRVSPEQEKLLELGLPISFGGLSEDLSSRQEDLERMERAILCRQDVEFSYQSPSRAKVEPWRVEPLQLYVRDNHLYLEGWDHQQGRPRTFRLDRIVRQSVNIHPQVRPALQRKARGLTLKLRVSPALAPYEIARRWPGRKEEPQADGSVQLEVQVSSMFEAVRLLLRYEAEVECLGPPQVRAEMQLLTARLYEIYNSDDSVQ